MKLIYIFVFFISIEQAFSQTNRNISPADYQLAELQQKFGNNKKFIPGLELQSLIALSFYPELTDCKIDFKLSGQESMAKTTLSFVSLIFNFKHFLIYINNNRSGPGLMIKDLPFNAQVGALGHELAHAADFMHKNLPGMIWWGIKYLNKNKRRSIERSADLTTIRHGLGWQLFDYTTFVMESPAASSGYKKFKSRYYLHPEEILHNLMIW